MRELCFRRVFADTPYFLNKKKYEDFIDLIESCGYRKKGLAEKGMELSGQPLFVIKKLSIILRGKKFVHILL